MDCITKSITSLLAVWMLLLVEVISASMYCDKARIFGQNGHYLLGERDCPEFTDRFLTIKHVPWGVEGRAWYTIPPEVYVTRSTIPDAGLGAFADTFLPANTWLGEYEGQVIFNQTGSDYAWSVECNSKESHLIDAGVGVFARTFLPTRTWLGEFEGKLTLGFNATGGDYAWRVDCGYQTAYYIDAEHPDTSNWLRWINCPVSPSRENVRSTLCYGHLYYITIAPVYPGQELFVYYGHEYAKLLKIDHVPFQVV